MPRGGFDAYDRPRVAVLVVVALVIVSLAVTVAAVVLGLRVLSRHLSRTRDQASTIFSVQMALAGLVQSALQRADTVATNGQSASRPATNGGMGAAEFKARQTAVRQLALLRDVRLKELTHSLLDRTQQANAVRDPSEAERPRSELEALHAGFGRRSTEVVRELNLRRR